MGEYSSRRWEVNDTEDASVSAECQPDGAKTMEASPDRGVRRRRGRRTVKEPARRRCQTNARCDHPQY